MTHLIVEEGGQRRAFKIGDGVLTLGTGDEARLKVTASDVAQIHAEIVISGGQVVLRSRPGVVPPTVGGQTIQGDAPLAPGVVATIGSVRLWLEGDQAPPAAAPAAAPAVQVTQQDRQVRREQAIAQAGSRGSRNVVQRTRPRVERGLPGGVIVLLILGGVIVVLFAGWKMFKAGAGDTGEVAINATLRAVELHIVEGSFDLAGQKLDSLSGELSQGQRTKQEELRDAIAERLDQMVIDAKNRVGTNYKNSKLQKYESIYLQGSPDKPKARVFLQRCRYFKQTWPDHPDREWVERQERRFRGFVNLSDPPTFEDVSWEVECLTRTSPREYKAAFEVIDSFIADAEGGALLSAKELHVQMLSDRSEYHIDRMQQARYEYEKEAVGQAVAWLVYAITMMGDQAMEDEAAGFLVKIPEVDQHLRGWRSKYPERFEVMLENDIVAEYVERVDL